MGEWTIYNLSGQSKAEVHNIEYEGNDGGARRVTVSVSSPIPIKWEVTDNISYRGEIFTLRHLPQEKKQARSGTHGEAFVYSDVVFYSAIDELASCEFLDVVKEDNNIHYSALPVFSFYCETIYDIADRLQANLDRVYTGAKKWTVEVSTDITAKIDIKPQALSFSKEKCSKVLERIVNELGVSYEYTNRTITFGAKPITMAYWFKYGKGEGLKSIGQSGADGNELVTRARVYGSTRNLPNRYYNKLYKNKYTGAVKYFKASEDYPDDFETAWSPLISETMYVPNLMLPMFRENGQDAYIDNEEAIAKYGLREGSVFFDGSGDDEEVYPTIENMTAERLAQSGIVVDLSDGDNGNLDELAMVEEITHSGVLPDNGQLDAKDSYFSVWLKDIGFDINDYLSTETAQISFNTGALAGRTFDIVKVEEIKLLFKQYKLTLKKVVDNTIQLAFPNTSYQPSVGDKFVLLGIEMPEVYILAAEQLLLEKGTEWSELNGKPNYTFTPEINDVEMLRKPHIAEQLKEGRTLLFSDEDLGIEKAVRISSLRISEEDGSAPKYEVTLSDKVSASLADRVTQSVVESLGTNSVSVSNINSLVQAYGNEHYLSKTKRDTAKQVIRFSLGAEYGEYIKGNQGANIDSEGNAEVESVTSRTSVKGETIQGGWIGTPDFAQGALLGTGGAMYQLNGMTYAEMDYLTIRKGMNVAELLIQEYKSIGGSLVVSHANGEIESVHKWSNGIGYDVYIKDWDKNPQSQFVKDDFVRCQYWDFDANAYVFYWVRVGAVVEAANGKTCINLFVSDLGDAIPQVGQKLVQMGNASDVTRQGCIVVTTENSLPRVTIYDGINEPTIKSENYKSIYGSLEGFVDPYTNEVLHGYGLWGDNAYLHGEFILSNGKKVQDVSNSERNILLATNQGTTNWGFGSSIGGDYTISESEEYNGYKGVKISRSKITDNSQWEVLRYALRTEYIKANEVYHISFDIRQSENEAYSPIKMNFAICTGGGANHLVGVIPNAIVIDKTNTWQHCDITFTPHTSGIVGGEQVIYIAVASDSLNQWTNLEIVNLKLEKSNVSSAWSKAPEDDVTFAEFKVTADGLSSRVSTTEGKVTQIEQDANSISLKVDSIKEGLSATGINIQDKKIEVRANQFQVLNNQDQVTAEVDAQGRLTSNVFIAKAGMPLTTINENLDGYARFYYPNTSNVCIEIGWDEAQSSLIRVYGKDGTPLWKLGTDQAFLKPDFQEWSEVKLRFISNDYQTAYNTIYGNMLNLTLDTYYQHNFVNQKAIVYTNRNDETSTINGYYTYMSEPLRADVAESKKWYRTLSYYENGVLVESETIIFIGD